MKSLFGILLIFGVVVTVTSCIKDELTKVTKKGANTFSCKVNGKIFKPVYVGGLFNDVSVLSVRNTVQDGFSISARNQKSSEDIAIENPYVKKTGIYKLRADYPNRGIYSYNILVGNDPGMYTTDSINTGELTITRCDVINHIYSGTFYFTAKNPATGNIVSVTNGRFDLKE